MTFSQFVKEHYDKVRDLPSKERLKKLGEMYRKEKGDKPVKTKTKKTKGGDFTAPIMIDSKSDKLIGNLGNGGSLRPAWGGSLKPGTVKATTKMATLPISVPYDNQYLKSTSVPTSLYLGAHEYF